MTETAFANYVNRDQSTVSHWLSDGVLTRDAPAQQWIRELIDHLAEQAAGRRGSGGKLDLCQERAALAKSQREKIDFDLRRLRGEFVSAPLVREWWDRQGAMVRTRILSVPSRCKSAHPRLSAREIYELDDLIRDTLTAISVSQLPRDLVERLNRWVNDGEEIFNDHRRARAKASKKARTTPKTSRRGSHPQTQRDVEGVRTA